RMTYAELNARANRLAHRLRSLGIGPDSLVGMFGERSLELMVGLVAILKAGGACVPLDIAYPKERLAFMLEDSRVPVVLTQRHLLDSLPPHAAETILLDESDDAHGPRSDENPSSGVTADNLLFVLYTSGSTGRPKGVAMPHRSLTNLITWHLRELDAPGPARTLQYTAISFDVSFQEIFTTLCGGGALVLIEDDVRKDAAALLRCMAEYGVERIFMPFIALQHMAEAAEAGAAVPSKLKDIVAGGEQLQVTPAVVALIRRLDSCRLHNHYGPTETHVVTNYSMEGQPGDWPTLPPVGRPVSNAQIFILDPRGRAVPAGVPGELYIGGDALSRAYANQPELTAERYVPHPLVSEPGERLYRTGDLARYLHDGNLEFLGRADHQVKIRGVRIELGEIETVLQQHEGVRDGVVVAREDGRGGRRLVAYVVPSGRQECTGPSLRRFLSEKLTEHMIPSAFVMLDALPLTPSGKVNRRALPAPDFSRVERAHAFVAPRTAAEEVVAEIWKQVLGVERVGATDNFFELGGHSLLGTQLISKLARAFRTELPLRQLFRSPTVEGLVGELAQVWGGREVVEEIAATYLEVERLTAAEIAETLQGQNEGASA
ncbi:MAG: amino acid adenylation domain-containing protein, partial [Acidobacteria bacterium]|nr:amino acid adenylation domain-containing protein [Acidobacteriota bacterium]